MKNLIALILLVVLMGAAADARGDDRPTVNRVDIYESRGVVVLDLVCNNLISSQVAGTIQSGLPAVIELLYKLHNEDRHTLSRGIHSYELHYDIWEDTYTVNRGDTVSSFNTFDEMDLFVRTLKRVAIIATDRVDPIGSYVVEISVAVHPLRDSDREQIVGWVDETVRRNGDDGWREQMLNINGLIHQFFGRERKNLNQSDWFRSMSFKPNVLENRDLTSNREGE